MTLLVEHVLHPTAVAELVGASLDRWKALARWRSRLVLPVDVPVATSISFPAPEVLQNDGSIRRVRWPAASAFWPATDARDWSERHRAEAGQVGASVVLVGAEVAEQVLGDRRFRKFEAPGRTRCVVARPDALDLALDVACRADEKRISLGASFVMFREERQGRVSEIVGRLFCGPEPVEIVDAYALEQEAFAPLCELLDLVLSQKKRSATLFYREDRHATEQPVRSRYRERELHLVPVAKGPFQQFGHDRFVRCGERVLMLGRGIVGFSAKFHSTAALLDDMGQEFRRLASHLRKAANVARR
jgi:hypothetical protein